jgi:hypothetical protein
MVVVMVVVVDIVIEVIVAPRILSYPESNRFSDYDVAVQRPGIGAGSGAAARPARRSAITPAR